MHHRPAAQSFTRLLAELGNAKREPRHLAAGGVTVDLAFARGLHELRLSALHCLQRLVAVAGCNRFLNLAHRAADAGAPCLVDLGAAGDLAGGFACGTRVGHEGLRYLLQMLEHPAAAMALRAHAT